MNVFIRVELGDDGVTLRRPVFEVKANRSLYAKMAIDVRSLIYWSAAFMLQLCLLTLENEATPAGASACLRTDQCLYIE